MTTADSPAADIREAAARMAASGDPFLGAVAAMLNDAFIYARVSNWHQYPAARLGGEVARIYLENNR
jgi:hypothetical protein